MPFSWTLLDEVPDAECQEGFAVLEDERTAVVYLIKLY
jgi:hypothetical protein